MIVVKEKKAVPHADVRCDNCGSLLQYGNADLHEDYCRSDGMTYAFQGHLRPYYFICPVCGCKVNANWIIKKENSMTDKEKKRLHDIQNVPVDEEKLKKDRRNTV